VQVKQALNKVRDLRRRGDDPLPALKRLQDALLPAVDSPLRLSLRWVVELLTEVLGPADPANAWALQQQTEAIKRLTRIVEARQMAPLDTMRDYGATERQYDPESTLH